MIQRLLTAVACLISLSAHAAPDKRPNIVILLADDMGYADAGFNGAKDIKTPRLDAMARRGSILESFYVQPCCSPTRAALLTGRLATHTGIYRIVPPHAPFGLPLEERTLADALRAAGYQTAITGKWHLGEFKHDYLPTHRGFDHQYGLWFGMINYFTHKRGNTLDWHRDDQPCDDEGYTTELIAREACKIIREKSPEKPLFLYVPFNAVHAPLQVPDQYKKPYTSLKEPRQTYAGMVAAMDEMCGQIEDALREKGILDNTLILFASDNGGPSPGRVTDNTPLRAGKGTIYEGGLRACAFALFPGQIKAGATIKEPMHVSDLYPTLIKLAGGSLEQKLPIDGLDIWPTLTQSAKSPHASLFLPGQAPAQAALRKGDWKILLRPSDKNADQTNDDDTAAPEALGEGVELYNLADDIAEKNNLATKHPDKLKALREELEQRLKGAVPSARK